MNKRRKISKIKNSFGIINETEDQAQSILTSIGTLTELRCIFGQNLETLTSIGDDLWSRQTDKFKMSRISTFKLNLTPMVDHFTK